MKKYIVFILFIISSLQASAQQVSTSETSKPGQAEHAIEPSLFDDYIKGYYSQVFGIDVADIINLSLYSTIEKWIGTPYRYAGKTLQGIDCSSFVNKIYESTYCLFLGNSSGEMYKQVKHLSKGELTEGDLVFFKTSKSKAISHVGVYLGNNKFAHASRSNGVVISDLNHPYYLKHFVKGGRVEFPAN